MIYSLLIFIKKKFSYSEISPAKIPFGTNKNSDPIFANVLESIGIGKALISRISHTPLPLPANFPHAPKILKKVDKLPVAVSIPSKSKSSDHTQSDVRNYTEQNDSSIKSYSEKYNNNANENANENENENENENCQIFINNDKCDDNIDIDNDNDNDNDSGKHCLPDKIMFLEQQYKEYLNDSNTMKITETPIENSENYAEENEKDYSDSSDMEIDMDMDLGYDSGDNCNNDIENNKDLMLLDDDNNDDGDGDDDDDDDAIDLIDFDTGYTGTSRLWSNRNGKILPVENGSNDTHDSDTKDISNLNLSEDSSTMNIDEKSNGTADAESDAKTSVARYRKSPLNSASNTTEPVSEKKAVAGTPRCGPSYQADVESFDSTITLPQPMDNVRTYMNTYALFEYMYM